MKPPEGKKYEPVKEGTHLAVCISVIDLGEQPDDFNEGQTKRMIRLEWELTKLKRDDGKNQIVSKEYSYYYSEKSNLYADLTSWLGKEFHSRYNIADVIGKACLLSITHKTSKAGNIYAKVSNVSQLIEGIMVPEPTYSFTIFDMENFDDKTYRSLAQFVKNKISNSKEYKTINGTYKQGAPENDDDDIPF